MKKLNKKNLLSKFLIVSFIVFSGCKSHKKLGLKTETINLNTALSVPVKHNIINYFEGTVEANGKTYNIGGKVVYENETDCFIQIKSNDFGVEVLRLKTSNDSIVLINRLQKKYYKGKICDYLKINNLTNNNLIRLIQGKCFSLNDEYQLKQINSSYKFTYNIGLNTEIILNNYNTLNQLIIESKTANITLEYLNFKKDKIAENIIINGNLNNFMVKGNVKFYNQVKLKNKTYKINIPTSYTSF